MIRAKPRSLRWALISSLLLLLGGCASYEKSDGAAVETADTAPSKHERGLSDPKVEGGDDGGGTADPYRERPGAQQAVAADDGDGSGVTAFCEPKRWPKVVPLAKRPKFPAQPKLSLALVRSGELAFQAKVVLALESLLESDPELKSVTALPAARAREATLASLAKQAHKAGRPLLLIDLRPGRKGQTREGLLLWTKTGAILAAWPVDKDDRPPPAPSDGSPLDLCDRLRAAYARLR